MLVVSPTMFSIHPIGCRGCASRITAPSTALPTPATLTSGQPWMPVDLADSGGYDAITSAVSTTARITLMAAKNQAARDTFTSARLAHRDCRHGDDHVGATGLVRAHRKLTAHRVRPIAHVPEAAGRQDPRGVEALPVIAHQQRQPLGGPAQLDLDHAGARVLDGVLHRLRTAEVQRRLQLVGVPADSAIEHGDPGGAGAHERAHRRRDTVL